MSAYYNEIDPFAAAWLRELIAAGHIAPGHVDERDIRDVRPDELSGYTQCHFFAGIGVWPFALRKAGWPDDRPIWTGSCPCQPFSAAGKGEGFADERHLWPAFFHLIEQCEPPVVIGEQVASGPTGVWFDLVQADLEGMGYAFGLVPLPAAGFGGAHIRDRAWWVAHADCARLEGRIGMPERPDQFAVRAAGMAGGVADALRCGTEHYAGTGLGAQATPDRGDGRLPGQRLRAGIESPSGRVVDPDGRHGRERHLQRSGQHGCEPQDGLSLRDRYSGIGHNALAGLERPGPPVLGRQPADWLFCRDAKWRPVEAGTFPLAHEAPARMGRLRGYGNGLDAETATAFIQAVIATANTREAA